MTTNVNALLTQAVKHQQLGKMAEAEAAFEKALVKAPTNLIAIYSLALILFNSNRLEAALKLAVKGVVSHPRYAPLWFLRGSVYQAMFMREQALSDYDRALKINPQFLDVLINSGALLREMFRYKDALLRFKLAVDADPRNELALSNYGVLLTDFKLRSQAIQAFQQLLSVNPDYPFCLGLMVYERMHLCDWDDIKNMTALITQGIREGKKISKTLGYMSLSDSASDHYLCGKIFANTFHAKPFEPMWSGEKYNHKKIKIAYVSPDFREHPVGHLMAGVIEQHDKTKFEVILISLGIDDQSSLRSRFIATADHFIDAKEIPARQIAETMRQLEVDIAIDLAGYTSDSRTEIFNHRPAPVQVNYLGYPGTMALESYDYILADKVVIPPEDAIYYTEKPVYIDYCYLPIASGIEIAAPKSRQEYGLPEQGFVFCAFSHDYKIHPDIFFQWIRLLKENPDSVLWLMSRGEETIANLRQQTELAGVDPARLIFAFRVPSIQDHLARYKVADLFLDTWPYNAHTTCADALLAGLPVITYKGNSFPSRVAASLVTAIGLEKLVTSSHEEYFQMANQLAKDKTLLNQYRAVISADKLANHPFLGSSFTRRIEKLFQEIAVNTSLPAQTEILPAEYQQALLHFQKTNYTLAEMHLRDCLKVLPDNPQALVLLEKIKHKFEISEPFVLSEKIQRTTDKRYLLIKAWGCGFWSDIHHVLNQLLLAELTQRTPIVLWGTNSFYRETEENAFPCFFKTDLFADFKDIPGTASIFPDKWNASNLLVEDNQKWDGPGSRLSAQYFFDRHETLLVSDFFSPLDTIIPWIDANSEYHGLNEDDIYAILFKKYLSPTDQIQQNIDGFYASNMQSKNWVAVHMRGSDKVYESPHLNQTNLLYYEFLDRILELNPSIQIFLMTDSEDILKNMLGKYGAKILTTQVQRSANNTGIHFAGHPGHQIGSEILTETYLAAKCDYFIGNKESNVSLAIYSLKNWANGFAFLLGAQSARGRNVFIFEKNKP